ncbi:hypothetical protein [Phreatobacter sp.]|uniref:NACHT domain-containing protein n=1 Tax=Phreatobacter sp. TaxID=1966341 RepID=UPI0022C3FB03|nr:hypothetical protein [Phreatobacter sp.]MCZ8314629.1 hypothetical protein [Phreatobacter sp.]
MLESFAFSLLEEGAKKGAGIVASNLLDGFFNNKHRKSKKAIDTVLKSYAEKTYERCTQIKTLIEKDEPINIFDVYVPLNFETSKKSQIDDFAAIELIEKKKKVMIVGSGGTGKSVFMKFLWTAMAVRSASRIPIFVELRNYVDSAPEKIDEFIYSTIFSSSVVPEGSREIFTSMLRDGSFIILLDALDEVPLARQQAAEREILRLADEYGDNIIVVSTREKEDGPSWERFTIFRMCPLSKESVITLIQKTDFDVVVKKRFIEAIESDLFNTHKSFLEIPLLACLMLIAFDQFADIPADRHLFYERAFITLFRRHDASKGAFRRQLKSSLPEERFREILAYTCLLSYLDEKFRFTERELDQYLEKAIDAAEVRCEPRDVRQDLYENVCIIQRDGLEYVFSHRSFQEYFAALCMASFDDDMMTRTAEKVITARYDMVMPMLYGIGRRRFNATIAKSALANAAVVTKMPEAQRVYKLLDVEGAVFYIHGVFSRNRKLKKGVKDILSNGCEFEDA